MLGVATGTYFFMIGCGTGRRTGSLNLSAVVDDASCDGGRFPPVGSKLKDLEILVVDAMQQRTQPSSATVQFWSVDEFELRDVFKAVLLIVHLIYDI